MSSPWSAGGILSRYEVSYRPRDGGLREVSRPELFETSHRRARPRQRLFRLEDALGDGWLKAVRLEGYAPRRPAGPIALQGVLFPYLDAL
jgi:hypothetical protein